MTKDDLLKSIAEAGYNVGIGAKKHWATYDIVNKIPGFINMASIIFGVYALVFDRLNTKELAATVLCIGIIAQYISFYDLDNYRTKASKLTSILNQMGSLYRNVKEDKVEDFERYQRDLQKYVEESYEISDPKQIVFSNWYAHFKFFWEHQIDWMDEQLHFRFFRDKIPLSAYIFILVVIVAVALYAGGWEFIKDFKN